LKNRIKGKCPFCGTERTISKNRLTDKRPITCLECGASVLPEEWFLSDKKKMERKEKELIKKQNQSVSVSTTPTTKQIRRMQP
jgi:hypothetical protein